MRTTRWLTNYFVLLALIPLARSSSGWRTTQVVSVAGTNL